MGVAGNDPKTSTVSENGHCGPAAPLKGRRVERSHRGVTSACQVQAEGEGGPYLQMVHSALENKEAGTGGGGAGVLALQWDVVLDLSSGGLLAPPAA